ncbi:MAG: RICIN domain-containing protein [Bacteroidales bacterium]|nr:RICIN domain-containing protein [Bacteroidales bacterium]
MKYKLTIIRMQKFKLVWLLAIAIQVNVYGQTIDRVEGSPFLSTMPPDTLYYSGRNLSESERFTLATLQGLLAKTKPEIIIYQYFHEEIIKESKLVDIPILYTYQNNLQAFLERYADRIDGYILCDPKSSSSNAANSLCSILNAVAVPTDIEAKAIAAGLTKILDVTGKDEAWAWENYQDQFNKDVAFFVKGDDLGLIDYTVYTGGFRFWDNSINTGGTLSQSVFDYLNPGARFHGWWVSEDGTVAKISENGFQMIPGSLNNLSTFTNIDVPNVKQKEPVTPYKVVENVHTVCFVQTDGDHIGWVAGAGYWDAWIWKTDNQSRIKMGFTLAPNLTELTPLIYSDIIKGLQTTPYGRNVAVAAPSGLGYYFPGLSPNHPDHCELLNKYMRKADMSIVNVIDSDQEAVNHNPEEYLKQSNIDALFYYTYGGQYQGMHGAIKWYKDKPSIGGRFVLWGNTENNNDITDDAVTTTLANILNAQSTNIYSEAGYSLVPVHIWTMQPHNVLNITNKLGPNVRVVAPDEFVWLIKKNLGGLAMGTGNGLKGEYFEGSNFETLKLTRIDKKVDFEWKEGSPIDTSDNFSVRWTGQIQPLYSEEYTFYVNADGGAKLTIDGTVVFDSLNNAGESVKSGKISLIAGEKHDIVIEYVEKTGNAYCTFEWESTSQLRQYVPFTQLYTTPLPTTGIVTVYAGNNKNGFSAGLGFGTYMLSDINSLGIQANEISSLAIAEGYKVILYANDSLRGESLELTSGVDSLTNFLLNDGVTSWGNNIKSVKVMANGDTTVAGEYYVINQASGYYLDVSGGPTNYEPGANVQVYRAMNKNNQVFHFTHLGDGVYKIIARHSKKVLTVRGISFDDNANIHQWEYFGSPNQKFIVVRPNDSSYKFIALHSGMAVNVNGLQIEANVQQNTNNNQVESWWKFTETVNREGTGTGLTAGYYSGKDFNTYKFSRIDPRVAFNWGESAPDPLLPVDNFSVRWTGSVQPRFTGQYTFSIISDNGRRLWVNNELIIDKWLNDWDKEYSGLIYLEEMKKYNIWVEYFEATGGANIKLEWRSYNEARETIPQSQLYPELTDSIPENVTAVPNTKIFLYPNPAGNTLYVSGLPGETRMEVFNFQGSKVLETVGTSVYLEGLPSGLYILKMEVAGRIESCKFVKE